MFSKTLCNGKNLKERNLHTGLVKCKFQNDFLEMLYNIKTSFCMVTMQSKETGTCLISAVETAFHQSGWVSNARVDCLHPIRLQQRPERWKRVVSMFNAYVPKALLNNFSMGSRVCWGRNAPMTLFKPRGNSDCDRLINGVLFSPIKICYVEERCVWGCMMWRAK